MNEPGRRHSRYQRADLILDVARRGIKGILRINPLSECLDFGIAGLRFGSSQQYQKGEWLVLDLRLYELEAREIIAQVVDSQPGGDAVFCTSVRFCFERRRMQLPRMSRDLLRIADKLRMVAQYPA